MVLGPGCVISCGLNKPAGSLLARALSNKGTVGAFSVARPSLANSLRSNRASERRPAPTKAPTYRQSFV